MIVFGIKLFLIVIVFKFGVYFICIDVVGFVFLFILFNLMFFFICLMIFMIFEWVGLMLILWIVMLLLGVIRVVIMKNVVDEIFFGIWKFLGCICLIV